MAEWIAFPLSLAVQLGLFGMAWILSVAEGRIKTLLVLPYVVAMLFSVLFSYALLQSEFTKHAGPQESRRALHDAIRDSVVSIISVATEAVNQSDTERAQLKAWVDLENVVGYTLRNCQVDQPTYSYLSGVCDRLREKRLGWERTSGRPYRDGPGQRLMHGWLMAELNTLDVHRQKLTDYISLVNRIASGFQQGDNNRERLSDYDRIVAAYPGEAVSLFARNPTHRPGTINLTDYARDEILEDERAFYAFDDLVELFDSQRTSRPSDRAVYGSLGLALFIDLFVLIIAVGASLVDDSRTNSYPLSEAIPSEWDDQIKRDIASWINVARSETSDTSQQVEFIRQVLSRISLDDDGFIVFTPNDADEVRFGHQMVAASAATVENGKRFLLKEWTYRFLCRFVNQVP